MSLIKISEEEKNPAVNQLEPRWEKPATEQPLSSVYLLKLF